MLIYNVFRAKHEAQTYCAVPEDRAVPRFLNAQAWEFEGKIDGVGPGPLGFDEAAAAVGVRFNGFYLFQNCV